MKGVLTPWGEAIYGVYMAPRGPLNCLIITLPFLCYSNKERDDDPNRTYDLGGRLDSNGDIVGRDTN